MRRDREADGSYQGLCPHEPSLRHPWRVGASVGILVTVFNATGYPVEKFRTCPHFYPSSRKTVLYAAIYT